MPKNNFGPPSQQTIQNVRTQELKESEDPKIFRYESTRCWSRADLQPREGRIGGSQQALEVGSTGRAQCAPWCALEKRTRIQKVLTSANHGDLNKLQNRNHNRKRTKNPVYSKIQARTWPLLVLASINGGFLPIFPTRFLGGSVTQTCKGTPT